MPWKECHVVDERLRFIARLLDGEKMAGLCAEFGISRKTSYKLYDRYKDCGLHGLTDRSRRPYRQTNQLPLVVEKKILRLLRLGRHLHVRQPLRHSDVRTYEAFAPAGPDRRHTEDEVVDRDVWQHDRGDVPDDLRVLPIVRPSVAPIDAVGHGGWRGIPTQVGVITGRLPPDRRRTLRIVDARCRWCDRQARHAR